MTASTHNEQPVELLKTMLLIRRFEEKVDQLYMEGLIAGPLHLYIGEEAVAAGVISCLRRDDLITSTHRGHGHLLAKGADPKLMMAELLGRITGYCKGRGGSMHIADVIVGNLGANGIVGGGIPIATGAALVQKMRRSGKVVVAFFGDGAVNAGQFHESLNFASLHRLPVVYVCENNRYAISTSVARACSIEKIEKRAESYGMLGAAADGMDVLDVRKQASRAVDAARRGDGPVLLVCNTYRFHGHSRSDPGLYRTKEEEEWWKGKCPIATFKEKLVTDGALTPAELEDLEKEAEAVISQAVEFGMSSPYPSTDTLKEDVYVRESHNV